MQNSPCEIGECISFQILMQKKPIIIISVLCVISLVFGYLSGLKEEESLSNRDAGTDSKKEPEFLKEGLVAYYPFNGNAKDESGNGNDGEIIGAKLIKDRFGNSDSAFEFDGIDDWIDLTKHNLPIAGSSPRTIGIWIKPRLNPRGYNALHTGVDTSRLGEADLDCRVAFHRSRAGNISIIAAPPHLKVGPKPDLFDRWSFHVFTYDGSSGSI